MLINRNPKRLLGNSIFAVFLCGVFYSGNLSFANPYTGDACCDCCMDSPPVSLCPNRENSCAESSSSAPVRYLDGVLKYKSPGLSFPGRRIGFSIHLGFNNHPWGVVDTHLNCGVNWWLQGVPFLEQKPDGSLNMIWGATSIAEFIKDGDTWYRKHGDNCAEITSGQELFEIEGLFGTKAQFHDFSSSVASYKRGKIKKITTVGGDQIDFSYCPDGVLSIVSDGASYLWKFYYDEGGGELDGQLKEIRVYYSGNVLVGHIFLEYYTSDMEGEDAFGLCKDLKSVEVKELTSDSSGSEWLSRKSYYRYYTSGPRAHRVKYILDPQSYADASDDGTVETMTDDQIEDYADYIVDYYTTTDPSSGAVKYYVASEKVRKSGCPGCQSSESHGTFSYKYYKQAEDETDPYNNWVTKVEQTNPDDTEEIIEVNNIGSPINVIRKVTDSTSDTKRWAMHYEYNNDSDNNNRGKLIEKYFPSACDVDSNNNVSLKDNTGLVEVYDYYSTAHCHALKTKSVKKGKTGNKKTLVEYEYTSQYPRISSVTKHIDADSTAKTSYSYTYYLDDGNPDNDAQIKVETKTPPAVPGDENGSGSSGEVKTCYHPVTGDILWEKVKLDSSSYRITVYEYSNNGFLKKKVVDPTQGTWEGMKPSEDGVPDPGDS